MTSFSRYFFSRSEQAIALFLLLLLLLLGGEMKSAAQDLNAVRSDQIDRLKTYVLDAIQPSGLVRDALVLDPNGTHFHPATPDAAGFALVSLALFDQLGLLNDAGPRVVQVLNAYSGNTPGVTPERSPDGHYIHFMDPQTGVDPPGWDDSYSPIGSALLVAGAQFARNYFATTSAPQAAQIDVLTNQLTNSIDFNAAIHPNLSGGVFLDMTSAGGGAGGTVQPWNEYQLVVSLALRQANRDRAVAVKHQWLNAENAPKRFLGRTPTLTDNPNNFSPAFWEQQAYFFNGDFRHDPTFVTLMENKRVVDRAYALGPLGETFRYGLTAGVSPSGYHADRLYDHPDTVFSPEAVAAWGDVTTLLDFYNEQIPTSDPRYRYGMVRVSAEQPAWIPNDAGLVDHLFLLFGLMESLHPQFFSDYVLPPLLKGDYNFDGAVNGADYTVWRDTVGSSTNLLADGNLDGVVNEADYAHWAAAYAAQPASSDSLPEPSTGGGLLLFVGIVVAARMATLRDGLS